MRLIGFRRLLATGRIAMLVLAIGLVPLAVGVGLVRRESSLRQRQQLDAGLHAAARDAAASLAAYFTRARAVVLLTASQPAFADFYALPGNREQRLHSGSAVIRRVNHGLAYLEQLYPHSIGEACFIDRSGAENARAVRGKLATLADLSLTEAETPFFAPTFALRPGGVYQARPYVSPDTKEWVVSNSTPVPFADGRKRAIVHFEVTVESFRRTLARASSYHLYVVDRETGAVVIDAAKPQRVGAPLGSPGNRRFAAFDAGGQATVGDVRAVAAAVTRERGNANRWLVVASAPAGGAAASSGIWLPGLLIAAALAVLAIGIGRRWVRLNADLDGRERRLIESERRYRSLFENANDLVYTLDREWRFTDVNRAVLDVTGYAREELLGRPLAELAPPDRREQLEQTLAAGENVFETEIVARDGRRIALEVGARAVDARGELEGYEHVARDVGARKLLEEQLRHAQKMEAIGCLAGGVAHDFNNILMAIGGYADLARAQVTTDSPAGRYVSEIRKSADTGASLTRQLLMFSRREVVQPRTVDVNEVVSDVQGMLGRLLGEDVAVSLRLDADPAVVRIDPDQLRQMILNLAINGRDAMPDGGSLELATSAVALNGDAHAVGVMPGDYVVLSVADTGHGMDAATKARVFEPFFTTKGSGTGLGLAIVYAAAQQHGGTAVIDSAPGAGTTVAVYIPASREPASAAAAANAAAPDGGLGGVGILLVEDEDAVRDVAATILESAGARVTKAHDAATALAALDEADRPIDVLLTDVVMPGASGYELAQAVTARRADVAVVMMSGYTEETLVRDGAFAGTITFVQKPMTAAELVAKVRLAVAARAA